MQLSKLGRVLGWLHRKDITMHSRITLALTLLALLAAAPLLAACHTTAGAGEDLSKTGQTITNSADQHTP
jgi:predicted small secreted protein